ncbi:MAG: hypothetical protein ACE5FN_01030 [Leptospirillia bacterium]
MTTDTQAESPAATVPTASGKRRNKLFTLVPDTRGAAVNGAIYACYATVSLGIALFAEANSLWFYAFYFLFFLSAFQGVTIVFRHCLHMMPKSPVSVEIVSKHLRISLKNGKVLELTRDIDYTRKKNLLVLQGKTHDNQGVSEVIRKAAMAEGDFDALLTALKRFR